MFVAVDDAGIQRAAKQLRDGGLVAFPTETVYGLGANALDAEAAKQIFAVKGRPPTDPLIVHVTSLDAAPALWNITAEEMHACTVLAKTFWPGPLTIVAKASGSVPVDVTGGSGFVGLRHPDHTVAQALLKAAGVPVAAPSANVFGHVSPTTAQHVMADLGPRCAELIVVDGGACNVGIESTVLKILASEGTLHCTVLRRGHVVPTDIKTCLASAGVAAEVTVRDTRTRATDNHKLPQDGPGQLLTHYSPSVPAFLIPAGLATSLNNDSELVGTDATHHPMSAVVVIDYGRKLAHTEPFVLAYRSLSAKGDPDEACKAVFDALRWCEGIEGAKAVVFPVLAERAPDDEDTTEHRDAVLLAVEDRLFRAASGRIAQLTASVTLRNSSMTSTGSGGGDAASS